MREVLKALQTLHDYCYDHAKCGDCIFTDLREDMGFICKVNQLVDDRRFYEVLKDVATVPDPTVTISSGTVQFNSWYEFDDDL